MATTKAADQISIIDITDSYTVMLTSEAYTCIGDTMHALATRCSTTVIAYQGSDSIPATIKENEIVFPDGVTSGGITGNGTTNPEITFIIAGGVISEACEVSIPIIVDKDVQFTKKFSIGVALKGTTGAKGDKGDNITITEKSVTYQVSNSGTTTPSGVWSPTVPAVGNGQFLWTKTYVKYSDGNSTEAYSVSYKGTNGSDGTSVSVTSTSVTYGVSDSGTAAPGENDWGTTVPNVNNGQYLWTKTHVLYSDGKETTSYSVSYKGTNGADGADGLDAISIAITSSNGFIFKNAAIETTLTAHVYMGGKEITETTSPKLSDLGTIKWYKDGSSVATHAGQTLTISGKDVTNKATYTAKLEG